MVMVLRTYSSQIIQIKIPVTSKLHLTLSGAILAQPWFKKGLVDQLRPMTSISTKLVTLLDIKSMQYRGTYILNVDESVCRKSKST